MACIRKRRDKFVVDYRDAFGVRRWITCETRRDADLALERALAESREPRRASWDPNLAVDTYAAHWLETIAGALKPRTIESYESALRLHVLPLLGRVKLRQLTRASVKTLVARKFADGLSKNSVRIIHATLHALLAEAVEDGLIGSNPAAGRGLSKTFRLTPSQGDREEAVKAFEREQLASFLASVAAKEPRHYAMFFTMARTGIRLGEAFGLRWDDIDLVGREMRVARAISNGRVETPKSGKARTVDMSPALRDVLRQHDAATKAAAFAASRERAQWAFPSLEGTPLDRANVEKAFKRALKAGGLPPHFTPHCLRHTYASLLLADGVNVVYVQEQLGHSSIRLTCDTYGRWLRKKAPGAVDRLDDAPLTAAGASSPGNGSKVVASARQPRRQSLQVVDSFGGPREDRTRDLLIANSNEGESEQVPHDLSRCVVTKSPDGETS